MSSTPALPAELSKTTPIVVVTDDDDYEGNIQEHQSIGTVTLDIDGEILTDELIVSISGSNIAAITYGTCPYDFVVQADGLHAMGAQIELTLTRESTIVESVKLLGINLQW